MRTFDCRFTPRVELPESFVWPRGAVDLEIGCGKGLHAISYARENPERHLIAVERTREKFTGLCSRLASHRGKGIALANLSPLCGDAISFLVHHFSEEEIFSRVFILYPNPYPKPSQANKRFHNAPAMSLIQTSLQTGGELTLATNEAWYADEARKRLCQDWKFTLHRDETFDHQSLAFPARTHFERKYLARGDKVYNLVFRKL